MALVFYDDIIFIIATFFNESEYYDFVKYFKLKMTLGNYFTEYNKYNKKIYIDEYLKSICYDINRNKNEKKYLKIIKSLDKTKSGFTEFSIVLASSYGFLKIIKLLHNIRILTGCFEIGGIGKDMAIDIACEKGYIEIVKYLYSIGYIPTIDHAFHSACCEGHLDVVDFLYSNGYTWSDDTMEGAIRNNKLDSVKYLYRIGFKITKEAIYVCYEQYKNNIFNKKNIFIYFQRLDCCHNIIHDVILESIYTHNLQLFIFLQYNKNNIKDVYLKKALKTNKYNIVNYIQNMNNKFIY
jgi:hypothetical protein